jgi:hypothetical protein
MRRSRQAANSSWCLYFFSRTVYAILMKSASSSSSCSRYRSPCTNSHSSSMVMRLPSTRLSNDSKHLTSSERASRKASFAFCAALWCRWMRPRRWQRDASNLMPPSCERTEGPFWSASVTWDVDANGLEVPSRSSASDHFCWRIMHWAAR